MGIESKIRKMILEDKCNVDIAEYLYETYSHVELFNELKDKYTYLNSFKVEINNEESHFTLQFEEWLYLQIERIGEEIHKLKLAYDIT